ncbi:STAS-like domain-containing protein [Ruminococcus champanellensis]
MMTINICRDFTETPGARYKSEGEFSGEEFRDDLLKHKYLEARARNEKLIIELDGGYGYATSFLEEAFGGLARMYPQNEVLDTLSFVSNDEPSLIKEINEYIIHANDKKKKKRKH